MCGRYEPEDLIHYLLIYPKYKAYRNKYLNKYIEEVNDNILKSS